MTLEKTIRQQGISVVRVGHKFVWINRRNGYTSPAYGERELEERLAKYLEKHRVS